MPGLRPAMLGQPASQPASLLAAAGLLLRSFSAAREATLIRWQLKLEKWHCVVHKLAEQPPAEARCKSAAGRSGRCQHFNPALQTLHSYGVSMRS